MSYDHDILLMLLMNVCKSHGGFKFKLVAGLCDMYVQWEVITCKQYCKCTCYKTNLIHLIISFFLKI